MNSNTDFTHFKLLPDWKPVIFHGHTIRSVVTRTLWNKIRQHILKTYNYTCCICDFNATSNEEFRKLHVHEVEEYDFENLVCHLKGLQLICATCHSFHHFQRTIRVLNKEQLIHLENHFMRVNNCEKGILHKCVLKKQEQLKNLNTYLLKHTTVTFTVNKDVPFYDEILKQLIKKNILFQ
ncbi:MULTISPECIES: hypothetical protein [Bacillus]|nr:MULTISPECIES: hypothetical protein [Bacillus]MBR9655000.1 hypothetical protein [Bacillus cereus]OKA31574.1 hypothetical protein BJR05_00085 [Bacillus cereus]PRP92313.1 hypothetical protein TUN_49470 [Bacillus sp. M21]